MTLLNIFLENERAIFFAGQPLKGSIELKLSDPKKINGLYFIINGRTKVHWTAYERRYRRSYSYGSSNRNDTERVHYEGKEVYLMTKVYVLGSYGGQTMEMPAGVYHYNFETMLPPMLPASFEASHGNIRYDIEACLDIPWRFDKETKVGFTVVQYDDLNMHPELRLPWKTEKIQTFCCLFCKSDPLLVTATIPYGGYTSGQTVPITIHYDNKSDVAVTATTVTLNRTVLFCSHSPCPNSKTEVVTVARSPRLKGVKALTSETVVVEFKIPQVLNSNKHCCGILQVSYDLKLEVIVSGCNDNFNMFFPITIGNVPINMDQQDQAAYSGYPAQMPYADNPSGMTQMPYNPSAPMPGAQMPYDPNASMPYNPMMSMPLPQANTDFSNPMGMPPPSFNEAVKMNHEKANSAGYSQPQGALGWNVQENPSAPVDKKDIDTVLSKIERFD